MAGKPTTTDPRLALALMVAALLWVWPAAGAAADAGDAGLDADAGQGEFELRADPLWEYDLPAGWRAEGAIIEGTREGGTLLAATVGQEQQRRCVVVRLQRGGDGWQVWGYPYERAQRPTVCSGVESRPGGGFFLRAHGDSMLEGRADGFVTSITSEGQQAWYVDDTPVAEADAFVGSYDRPGSTLIYSWSADLLLSTTVSAFAPLMSPRRDVTHFSVLRDGAYRVDALTVGTDAMFGRLAETIVRGSDGTFWFVVTRPDSTQGADFFNYDGRQNLERRQVLEGQWEERFVKAIESGPDGTLYILWRESAQASAPGHLVALEGQALEPRWQRTYEDAAEGIPVDVVAAPDGLVVLYRHASGDSIVRLDRDNGDVEDVLDVESVTSRDVPALLQGPQGGVKFLGYDPAGNNMREWAVRWNEPGGNDGSDNPGASGCHTLEPHDAPTPGGGALLWAGVAVAVACRRGARYNK